MQLNLPILEQLSGCHNVLIAGMGGGFDVFCGLPIYFELLSRGKGVHLASFSLSLISRLKGGNRLSNSLVGITADYGGIATYFPEFYLSQWFRERRGSDVTVWCFEKTGAQPLLANYRTLVEHLAIDAILLIDGGVDSLVRGDEEQVGTVLEDALSLAAVRELDTVPLRLLGCLGFGAEREVAHAPVLENVAALAEAGHFLGTCSLVRQMEAYGAYEEAVLYVHEKRFQDPSVINASVISAVQGHYGNFHLTEKTRGSRLWISPLMPIYWFFDFQGVADRNLFLSEVSWTDTVAEALRSLMMWRQRAPRRPASTIALP